MLTVLDACEQKFFNEFILKLAPLAISPDLHAGGAFSKGTEATRRAFYVEGKDVEASIAAGVRALIEFYGDFTPPHYHPKTCENMVGALDYYFRTAFPLGADVIAPFMFQDRTPAIEFSFSIPTEVPHPTTGDPILFGGRCDMIAKHMMGPVAIMDDKTTKNLGEAWAKQWRLRGQFLGYTYAAWEHDIPVSMAIIRGMGILKTKYSHLEAIEQYSKELVHRWWANANAKLRRAVQTFKENSWKYSFGDACAAYGGCQFHNLCLNENPASYYDEYQERIWNPLLKDPTLPPGGMTAVSYADAGSIYDTEAPVEG